MEQKDLERLKKVVKKIEAQQGRSQSLDEEKGLVWAKGAIVLAFPELSSLLC